MKTFRWIIVIAVPILIIIGVYLSHKDLQTEQALKDNSKIGLTESVEGGKPLETFIFNIQDKKTALELLEQSYKVETKDSAQGKIVVSIDGKAPASGQAWVLYVNGKPAQISADKYLLQDGDSLEWKMQAIKN